MVSVLKAAFHVCQQYCVGIIGVDKNEIVEI